MRISTDSCKVCDDIITNNSLPCNSAGKVVIRWNDICVISLYFVDFVISLTVFLCLLYFWKNRNSPLVKSCYSCPDNVLLAVLSLFCLLPKMHIGELSTKRCILLSLVVNVIFSLYTSLLLTKTLFVQNLLKCQAVGENPDRRVVFSAFIVILQIIILTTLPFYGFPNLVRFSCAMHRAQGRVVTLCDIRGNISVLSCMLYNWMLFFVLSFISIFETLKHSKDSRRTQNLVAVAIVGLLSYTCLTSCAYLNLELKDYILVTLALYVVYLINPVVCLSVLYLPTIFLILTCLHQQENFQRKSKLAIPRKRKSSAIESLFSYLVKSNLGPESHRSPNSSHSSGASHLSYPSSLVSGVRDSIRVVSSFPTSVDASRVDHARNCESFHDNIPRTVPAKENCKPSGISTSELQSEDVDDNEHIDIEVTYEELKEWLSFLKDLDASDV